MLTFTRKQLGSCILVITLLLTSSPLWAGSLAPFDPTTAPAQPNYAEKSAWLASPDNPDQYRVDVFWVYPTILADNEHWLMDMTSQPLQELAQDTIIRQASVFTGQANLYAPYYRQMNMAGLALSPADRETVIKFGRDDVMRALDYYLTHYNKGRPFILAGHSQGSNLLTDILREKWGSMGVEDQLVAGYIIGWSITQQNLKDNPALTICSEASQTNCFISYNTMAAGKQSVAPTLIKGAVVVNPLSWRIDGVKAPAELNIGTTLFEADGSSRTLPHFTSAQVVDSGLVVEPADLKLVDSTSSGFPEGVYHVFDYSFFYENLRANLAQRIQAFMTRKQH